ncbi:MAG: lipid II flippase MurJ, partial [Pseudomonadota bacterium]
LTPVYVDLLRTQKPDEAAEFLSSMLWTYIAVVVSLFALCGFFSEWVIRIFAPGFAGDRLVIAKELAIYAFPLILSMGANGFCRVLLESRKQFVVTKVSQALIPISVLALLLLKSGQGVQMIFLGLNIGYLLAVGVQVGWLWVSRVKLSLTWRVRSSAFQKVRHIIAPLLLGNLLASCSPIVDRAMISLLSEGDLGVYGYTQIIISNVTLIFVTSLSTTLLPVFSHIKTEGKDALTRALADTLRLVLFVIFPLGLFLALYSLPLIELLFERGAFTSQDTLRMAPLLGILAICMTLEAGVLVFARTFNALLDAKTTMIGGVLNLGGKVILNFLLMQKYGVYGIAVSTLLVNTLVIAFFSWRIHFVHQMTLGLTQLRELAKIVLVSLSGVFVAKLVMGDETTWVLVGSSAAVGVLVFLLLSLLLKIKEGKTLVDLVLRKFGVVQ